MPFWRQPYRDLVPLAEKKRKPEISYNHVSMVNYVSTYSESSINMPVCVECRPIGLAGLYEPSSSSETDIAEDHLKHLTMLALAHETPKETPSRNATLSSLKRKFQASEVTDDTETEHFYAENNDVLSIADSKVRRIEIEGKESFSIDGVVVPRLQIGESGRVELKASLTTLLKLRPDLRKQTNRISKLKCASINQLLTMAMVCGIWEKAVKISETYVSRRKSV